MVTSILRNPYSSWCIYFYKLYKLDSYEEFKHQWLQFITKYGMCMNKHVIGLYQIKHFGVPCYLGGYFFGGMKKTWRSDSINAYVKWFVSSHIRLIQFVKRVSHYLPIKIILSMHHCFIFVNVSVFFSLGVSLKCV